MRAVALYVFAGVVPAIGTPLLVAPFALAVAEDLRPEVDNVGGVLGIEPEREIGAFAPEVGEVALAG